MLSASASLLLFVPAVMRAYVPVDALHRGGWRSSKSACLGSGRWLAEIG